MTNWKPGGPDSDGDGLPDAGEYALGTRPDARDSDGDGLSDAAELTQGLNPNDDRSFPTGIIASLPLTGEARELVVEENLAYVATGSYGLALVDVSRFDNPINLGQLDLPGDATFDTDRQFVHTAAMKSAARRELGQFIVADPKICRGKPTFKGTRVTVGDVLADVQRGLSWDFICYRWGDGKITREAIAEAVQLARRALLDADGRLAHEVAAA